MPAPLGRTGGNETLEQRIARIEQENQRLQQTIAKQQQATAYLVGQSQAAGGGGAPPRVSKTEQLLTQVREANPQFAEVMQNLLDAQRQDLEAGFNSRLQQEVGQIRQPLHEMTVRDQLEQHLETRLVPRYGEKVRDYYPQIRERAMEAVRNGGQVVPEDILEEIAPDKWLSMLTETSEARRRAEQEAARATAQNGFNGAVNTGQPPFSGGANPFLGGDSAVPEVFDPVKSHGEIMAAMGLG